jgi:hypothetical protein
MIKKKFLPNIYTDKETERLTKEYDVTTCPDYPVPSSLGQYEDEIGAQRLLGISKCFTEFVGIDSRAILKIDNRLDFGYIFYLEKKYLRRENRGKLEIIFPTEELLINQKIKKYEK